MSECKHFEHGKPTETTTRIVGDCPLCHIDQLELCIESWKREESGWNAEVAFYRAKLIEITHHELYSDAAITIARDALQLKGFTPSGETK